MTLMQYIIWVTDFSTRSIPVHMYGIFSWILFQIIQTYIVRNTHQLIDSTVCTIFKTILCFGTWQWNLSVDWHPFIQFCTSIQVDIYTIQLFIREHTLVIRCTERSTEMWCFSTVADRHIVILWETSIKIILQLIAIFWISICLTIPSFKWASIQYGSPATWCFFGIASTTIGTNLSLAITFLLL